MSDQSRGTPLDWRKLHLWQIQPIRDALLLAAIIGVVYLGYLLSVVTVPALLALLLAYLLEPVVRFLIRVGRLRRPFVAMLLIIGAGALVFIPAGIGLTFGVVQGVRFADQQRQNIARLVKSVDQPDDPRLAATLPSDRWRRVQKWLVEQESLARALNRRAVADDEASSADKPAEKTAEAEQTGNDKTAPAPAAAPTGVATPPQGGNESKVAVSGGDAEAAQTPTVVLGDGLEAEVRAGVADLTAQLVDYLRQNSGVIGKRAVQAGAGAVQWGFHTLGSVAGIVFGAFLTAFFFYFFSTSWGSVLQFWESLIPEKKKGRYVDLLQRFDAVIAGFIRGRLTIAACQIVLFTVGYWIIGVPVAFIIGPIIGLLTLVPYLASIGVPLAMVLLGLEGQTDFRGAWWWIIGAPLAMQGISQVLDDYILSPRIQGKNTDLNMPLILFASIAGGVLAGVYGLLVAIPVAACLKIVLREVFWPRIEAWTMGRAPDPLPLGGAENEKEPRAGSKQKG